MYSDALLLMAGPGKAGGSEGVKVQFPKRVDKEGSIWD
ncbi:hypothetical protein HKBW3S33_01687 [Candidatus Hakubella thermalkaliphila]|uniref:Uncharacterized protein n=1 Tax=Candidatus Hakubella thermalkaliphila TaxID=2754717 RepID=A0A6V8P6H9_9ACTN|nr:hypothetical protein HKBW3S33_01687 [Candidatus Hakubella thermalkaliphila]